MLYLYCITNGCNGKKYIGVSNNSKRREKEHFSSKGSILLRREAKKYGKENFKLEILGVGENKFIFELEKQEIKLRNTQVPNGYNLTAGGEYPPSCLGKNLTEEHKRKIGLANLGKVCSPETRMKLCKARQGRKPNLGHKHTPENIEKMRVRMLGNKYPLGYKHTEATKERMRKAAMGNKNNLGCKNNIKPIKVNGVIYGSIKDLAEAINVNYQTLCTRIQKYNKTNDWPSGWGYV